MLCCSVSGPARRTACVAKSDDQRRSMIQADRINTTAADAAKLRHSRELSRLRKTAGCHTGGVRTPTNFDQMRQSAILPAETRGCGNTT